MALPTIGTPLADPLITQGPKATHYDVLGAGGYRAVATLTERDAITAARRSPGMWVKTLDTGLVYELGLDLLAWTLVEFGGAGVGEYLTLAERDAQVLNAGQVGVVAYVRESQSFYFVVEDPPGTFGWLDYVGYQPTADTAGNFGLTTLSPATAGLATTPGEQSAMTPLASVIGNRFKRAVNSVILQNVALTGIPPATDATSVLAGHRVLLLAQADPAENAIWNVAAGPWTRAVDAPTNASLFGAVVPVIAGTLGQGALFVNRAATVNANPSWGLQQQSKYYMTTTPAGFAALTQVSGLVTSGVVAYRFELDETYIRFGITWRRQRRTGFLTVASLVERDQVDVVLHPDGTHVYVLATGIIYRRLGAGWLDTTATLPAGTDTTAGILRLATAAEAAAGTADNLAVSPLRLAGLLSGKENAGVAQGLVTALLNGVATDGNTLFKLRAFIASLQTSDTTQASQILALQNLIQSNDLTLDTVQEIVTFIKDNKAVIDSISTNKLNLSVYNDFLLQYAIDLLGKENVGVAAGLVAALLTSLRTNGLEVAATPGGLPQARIEQNSISVSQNASETAIVYGNGFYLSGPDGSLALENLPADGPTIQYINNLTGRTLRLEDGKVSYRDTAIGAPYVYTWPKQSGEFALNSQAQGSVLYVATTGSDALGQRGNPLRPLATLVAAHDAASVGDTIVVIDGTHSVPFNRLTKLLHYRFGPSTTLTDSGVRQSPDPDNSTADPSINAHLVAFALSFVSEGNVAITGNYPYARPPVIWANCGQVRFNTCSSTGGVAIKYALLPGSIGLTLQGNYCRLAPLSYNPDAGLFFGIDLLEIANLTVDCAALAPRSRLLLVGETNGVPGGGQFRLGRLWLYNIQASDIYFFAGFYATFSIEYLLLQNCTGRLYLEHVRSWQVGFCVVNNCPAMELVWAVVNGYTGVDVLLELADFPFSINLVSNQPPNLTLTGHRLGFIGASNFSNLALLGGKLRVIAQQTGGLTNSNAFHDITLQVPRMNGRIDLALQGGLNAVQQPRATLRLLENTHLELPNPNLPAITITYNEAAGFQQADLVNLGTVTSNSVAATPFVLVRNTIAETFFNNPRHATKGAFSEPNGDISFEIGGLPTRGLFAAQPALP